MTDPKTYPACLDDTECTKLDTRKENEKNYHACFQYFCYPWKEKATVADKKKQLPFKGCRKSKDCRVNGKKGFCYR